MFATEGISTLDMGDAKTELMFGMIRADARKYNPTKSMKLPSKTGKGFLLILTITSDNR